MWFRSDFLFAAKPTVMLIPTMLMTRTTASARPSQNVDLRRPHILSPRFDLLEELWSEICTDGEPEFCCGCNWCWYTVGNSSSRLSWTVGNSSWRSSTCRSDLALFWAIETVQISIGRQIWANKETRTRGTNIEKILSGFLSPHNTLYVVRDLCDSNSQLIWKPNSIFKPKNLQVLCKLICHDHQNVEIVLLWTVSLVTEMR